MKIMIIGDKRRYDKFAPTGRLIPDAEMVVFKNGTDDEALLEGAWDADVILIDAIGEASRRLIERMPRLRMIHSEGVGYEGIDIACAKERGVYVCNNKGCNDTAVAEQALLLMLGLLRGVISGDRHVREGNQHEAKLNAMVSGITELRECVVGLIGLGDIGKATARILRAFGSEVRYCCLRRKSQAEEDELGVKYLPLMELAEQSDIVSVHAASTKETKGIVGAGLLSRMKPTAYLINTARGELVDNMALREALISGRIAGAGLDTIWPEPTGKVNPLVDLPPEHRGKVIYSPHYGGITTGSMRRAHARMWENVARLSRGERPDCVVNGL
jgi:lactate dehydrogenase-like 2-hydroxyacid dehydrogenase